VHTFEIDGTSVSHRGSLHVSIRSREGRSRLQL
jgi:hypothetical protein